MTTVDVAMSTKHEKLAFCAFKGLILSICFGYK